jgi:hypothetical protein
LLQIVAVRRFNQSSSVQNIRVERHWREVNRVTQKYKEEFYFLVSLGAFVVGDHGDTFSLIFVYLDSVEADVNAHYIAMRQRKKKKSTTNPEYPSGTWRREDLHTSFESHLMPLPDEDIENLRDIGVEAGPPDDPSPWQMDPLGSTESRGARAEAIAAMDLQVPSERYVAHRSYTKVMASDNDQEAARDAAVANVAELRRRIQQASTSA